MVWSASSDNVGVAGYSAYLNGNKAGTTTQTLYTYSGLSCGKTYTVALSAFDAAGNASSSAHAAGTTSTAPCATPPSDGLAPSVPGGLVAGSVSGSSVSLSWDASTDNVGVAGYGVYSGGSLLGSTASRSYSVSGLACGTSYAFAVDAYDAAGNRSGKATRSVETSACTPPPPPPSGGAGLYLSPSGSDSSSCSQAAPCRSFDRAYDLAQPGQTVQVAGGYYDCGSVTGSKSADVTFQAAPGVSATTTCEMAVSATHVVFRDLDLAGLRLGGSARYVTLRNVDVTCEDRAPFRLYGSKCSAGLFIAGPASDFAMYGGSVGPTWDSDVDGSPGNSQIGIPYGGGPAESKNLLFDGVRFHDNRIAPGAHSECLMVGGGNGLIFRNMRFDNCNIFGIYFTWWNFVSPSYPVATNILIENSWFEEPLAGSGDYAVRFGDYMGAFRDITVRNNSWTGLLSIGDSPKTNVNFIGNVGPLSQGE